MNIAVILQSPDIGGAETLTASLIDSFTKQKQKVILATNNTELINLVNKNSIYSFKKLPFIIDIAGDKRGFVKTIALFPWALFFYIRLFVFLKKNKIDVILVSGFSEKLLTTFVSIFFKIPVVWIEYGSLNIFFEKHLKIPKIIYYLLSKFPKYVVVPSISTQNKILEETNIKPEKVKLIYNGVRIQTNVHKNFKLIKDLNIEGKFVIGNVSRLTREKGQEYLIKAMPKILGDVPNAILLIVGRGPDNKYFQNIAQKLEISDKIKFVGYVENLEDYYCVMDVFVFPTTWDLEGFGMVMVEAMSYGLPVIGSDFGPVKEVVGNRMTGFLVPVKNSKEIAEAVIKLSKDTRLKKKMGERGYEKAKSDFNLSKSSKTYLDLLKNVAKRYN